MGGTGALSVMPLGGATAHESQRPEVPMRECVTIAISTFMPEAAVCSAYVYKFILQTESMRSSITIIPILQVMKLRHRKGKQFAQIFTAKGWWNCCA